VKKGASIRKLVHSYSLLGGRKGRKARFFGRFVMPDERFVPRELTLPG
jgi:hypothetical protein